MSSVSTDSLLVAKDAEIRRLRAEKASFARIAAQAVALLRARDEGHDKSAPGLWLREDDRSLMSTLQTSAVSPPFGGPWRWVKITKELSQGPPIHAMLTSNDRSLPRPVLTPFRSAFPLEILQHIVDLAGLPTMAVFARTSYASLEFFAPRLLASVNLAGNSAGLQALLVARDASASFRLASALSLHHIQTLDVPAWALVRTDLSPLRLSPGPSSLHLHKLVIRMDLDIVSPESGQVTPPLPAAPQAALSGGAPTQAPAQGSGPLSPMTLPDYGLGELDDFDMDDYDGNDDFYGEAFFANPFPGEAFFRPSPGTLALFNPASLVVRPMTDAVHVRVRQPRPPRQRHRVSREGATAIASLWTRLESITLVHLDLFVLAADGRYLDDGHYEPAVLEGQASFFLGPSIVDPLEAKEGGMESQGWTVTWDASDEVGEVRPFVRVNESLPAELAERDETLRMERLKGARILVRDEETRVAVEGQIAEIDEKKRGPLTVEVKGGDDA